MMMNNIKKKLLVVDHAETTHHVLERFLGEEFDIILKNDGLEAWSYLNSGQDIDFMITELNMPKMNGKELIKALRQSNLYAELPIILLSGSAESHERIECMNLGADNFIEKPFNPLEIQARINAIFRLNTRRYINS
jgi:DNA-binding response OmpR family regulator